MVEPGSRNLLYEVRRREMTVPSFDDFYEYLNAVLIQESGVFKKLDLEEPENSQEWQEHDLLLPFGEVGTYIALVNKRDDDFTTIDNSTLSRVIKAGCSNQIAIYLLLHQRSYTDPKTGKLVATPTTYAWLMEETGFSLSKVKNHIKKLNDAELINCYLTRQMAEPGNSKQAGNCYGINYRRYTGKPRAKNASTYDPR
jgi:hypothetical protein